ncbi:aminotransferase class I/II-fold pyridoxal phosphate-dependent enzyme [Streptomyces alboflavus]|uniref:aminotransferase class I/II-fold pyridoxal phosphate-dependent enzyme n=1 Tax=Streptomyces alboflavus TaxID=67267 RepID=UPI003AAC6304
MLRTLSKAWGLAGARCGVALAQPGIIEALRRLQVPFGFTDASQRAVRDRLNQRGPGAREHQAHPRRAQTAGRGTGRTPRGGPGVPSQTNFLLVRLHKQRPGDGRLRDAGIAVADTGHVIPATCRISIGNQRANDAPPGGTVLRPVSRPTHVALSQAPPLRRPPRHPSERTRLVAPSHTPPLRAPPLTSTVVAKNSTAGARRCSRTSKTTTTTAASARPAQRRPRRCGSGRPRSSRASASRSTATSSTTRGSPSRTAAPRQHAGDGASREITYVRGQTLHFQFEAGQHQSARPEEHRGGRPVLPGRGDEGRGERAH